MVIRVFVDYPAILDTQERDYLGILASAVCLDILVSVRLQGIAGFAVLAAIQASAG